MADVRAGGSGCAGDGGCVGAADTCLGAGVAGLTGSAAEIGSGETAGDPNGSTIAWVSVTASDFDPLATQPVTAMVFGASLATDGAGEPVVCANAAAADSISTLQSQ